VGTVSARAIVALDPADARDLWLDTSRWATFVDGFSHVERVQRDWPAEGGVLTWMSTPHGRGHVREAITTYRVQEVTADVADSQLTGTQRATFVMTPAGTEVEVALTYRLQQGNPVVDLLFVRRALRDSLRRTVLRFAREAFADAELARSR
jgi:hypothetical protein